MAIKQRKQVTGTTAQINAYAGVEGQLVWDKTKKKWVGMSGTAGTNYPMASERHQHSVANVTDLQKYLGEKATKTDLSNGLATKADASHTHTIANVTGLQDALNGKLNTADKIPYSQLTGAPSIPDTSGLIPKTGDGGTISVYETMEALPSNNTISMDSPGILLKYANNEAVNVTLSGGVDGKGATKMFLLFDTASVTFTTPSGVNIIWANNKAPTFKKHNIVLLSFHHAKSIFGNLASAWD